MRMVKYGLKYENGKNADDTMLMAKRRWQNTDDKNVDNKMWMDSEKDKMRIENREGQYVGDK